MTDMQKGMMLASTALPCVPLFIPLDRRCAWSGKWACNWDTESVKRAGGPWDTQEEACAAIMATVLYVRREGMPEGYAPHFDRVK